MTIRILTVSVRSELDVVGARQRSRQIAAFCNFGNQDQVRIATSVSELARNIYNYAGTGKVHFMLEGETAPQVLVIQIEDQGPGIANIEQILAGTYQSPTGMGIGIPGARQLMDRFEISTGPTQGTRITLQKFLPRDAPLVTGQMVSTFCSSLAVTATNNTMAEVLRQNQELVAALAELKSRQEDLLQLTRELEDTNRGVVALYAELDEKADHLRRADEMKSRFLSNMSHEFRTPLSSIRALATLLLDRVDGALSHEQEKQVSLIMQSALALTELVNDLLDLAKIEAGKIDVRVHKVEVVDLFRALRGMLRPLLVGESVKLIFNEPDRSLCIDTDEAKLSQILRNFISNALKFTELGEINIRVAQDKERGLVTFSVADTGIGINGEDIPLIFEEFGQIEHPLQRKTKGTGLGLPLCKKLATLLGGYVVVESLPAVGSTFSLILPQTIPTAEKVPEAAVPVAPDMNGKIPVLLVEDQPSVRMVYEKFLLGTEFRLVPAASVREAMELWPKVNPAAVILDILLHGEHSWYWLAELKNDQKKRRVPIIVATEVEDRRKGLALGADAYYIKPLLKQQLITSLRELICVASVEPQWMATQILAE